MQRIELAQIPHQTLDIALHVRIVFQLLLQLLQTGLGTARRCLHIFRPDGAIVIAAPDAVADPVGAASAAPCAALLARCLLLSASIARRTLLPATLLASSSRLRGLPLLARLPSLTLLATLPRL